MYSGFGNIKEVLEFLEGTVQNFSRIYDGQFHIDQSERKALEKRIVDQLTKLPSLYAENQTLTPLYVGMQFDAVETTGFQGSGLSSYKQSLESAQFLLKALMYTGKTEVERAHEDLLLSLIGYTGSLLNGLASFGSYVAAGEQSHAIAMIYDVRNYLYKKDLRTAAPSIDVIVENLETLGTGLDLKETFLNLFIDVNKVSALSLVETFSERSFSYPRFESNARALSRQITRTLKSIKLLEFILPQLISNWKGEILALDAAPYTRYRKENGLGEFTPKKPEKFHNKVTVKALVDNVLADSSEVKFDFNAWYKDFRRLFSADASETIREILRSVLNAGAPRAKYVTLLLQFFVAENLLTEEEVQSINQSGPKKYATIRSKKIMKKLVTGVRAIQNDTRTLEQFITDTRSKY